MKRARSPLPIARRVSKVFRAAAEIERRRRGDEAFPADLQGACYCASTVLLLGLAHHGVAAELCSGLAWGTGHAWVEAGSRIIDLTATQFGMDEDVGTFDSPCRLYMPVTRWTVDALAGFFAKNDGRRSELCHPCRHYDLMVPALAAVLGIDEDAALLRVLDIVGPPYMAPRATMPKCWKRLGKAVAKAPVEHLRRTLRKAQRTVAA